MDSCWINGLLRICDNSQFNQTTYGRCSASIAYTVVPMHIRTITLTSQFRHDSRIMQSSLISWIGFDR